MPKFKVKVIRHIVESVILEIESVTELRAIKDCEVFCRQPELKDKINIKLLQKKQVMDRKIKIEESQTKIKRII